MTHKTKTGRSPRRPARQVFRGLTLALALGVYGAGCSDSTMTPGPDAHSAPDSSGAVASAPAAPGAPRVAPPLQIATPGPHDRISPAHIRLMDTRVEAAIREGKAPGAVLVVGTGGQIVHAKAFGFRSTTPTKVPMTLDTVFDLASVSKVLGTATTTMALLEEGKLSLDDKVAKYIPEFATGGKEETTVRDLLVHRSGLPAYDSYAVDGDKRRGTTPRNDALIQRIASLKTIYTPRENFVYSCLNYLTLARVNELAAGESQESILRRRIWTPLGMNSTAYTLGPSLLTRTAPCFAPGKGGKPPARPAGAIHDPLAYFHGVTPEHCPGNAGLYSSALDIAQYCQMIVNGGELGGVRVLTPETVASMTALQSSLPEVLKKKDREKGLKPDIVHRAFGWGVYSPSGSFSSKKAPPYSFIGHTGYTGTYVWIDKNSKSFVILLANAVYSEDPPKMGDAREQVVKATLDGLYGKR